MKYHRERGDMTETYKYITIIWPLQCQQQSVENKH